MRQNRSRIRKSSPLVSIIIVNWNGREVLRSCLDSLYSGIYKNWELIIVDNASSDKSADGIVCPNKLKIIRNSENKGFAPANNQGLKAARGKYVLLLNNDTKVSRDLLSILVEKMELDETIGAIQPKIKMMDKPDHLDNAGSFFTWIGFLKHWGFWQKDGSEFDHEKEVFSAKGACLMVRKSLTDKIGLFDDQFVSYFEESDLCWRVWLSGFRVVYYPKTFILHKVGFTIKRLDVGNINFHYYKNRISSLIKNLSVPRLIVTLPVHIIISIGISLVFLISGSFTASMLIPKAIFWNLINLNTLLRKRGKVQSFRKLADSEFLPRLSKPVVVELWNFYKDFKRVRKDIVQKTT